MARQIIEKLIDDITGKPASETVCFSLESASYEIDLSAPNAAKLRSVFTEFITHGRKVTVARNIALKPKGKVTKREKAAVTTENARIREWAQRTGFDGWDPKSKGRIPGKVLQAYDVATSAAMNGSR